MTPINQVNQYLSTLRLTGMQATITQRIREASDATLGYEDFLNLCLFDEDQHRQNERIRRLIRAAEFKCTASLEGIDFATNRALDKKQINDFAKGRYIDNGNNILILGPTGVGKSFLASALGNAACRMGKSVIFCRMNTLAEKLTISRVQGNYLNYLKKLTKADLVILDDFGIKPLIPQQFQDVYDIMDERFESKATIITSQLPVANWSEIIPDAVTLEAITDRIISKAVKIEMSGDSYRNKRFKKPGAN